MFFVKIQAMHHEGAKGKEGKVKSRIIWNSPRLTTGCVLFFFFVL